MCQWQFGGVVVKKLWFILMLFPLIGLVSQRSLISLRILLLAVLERAFFCQGFRRLLQIYCVMCFVVFVPIV
jgi:hypothetical protein